MRRYYIFIASLCAVSLLIIIIQTALSSGAVKDQKTSDDISLINTDIQNYVDNNKSLPQNLSQIQVGSSLNNSLPDYIYTVGSTSYDSANYQICATFHTNTTINGGEIAGTDPSVHKSGYQCFTQTVYGVGVTTPVVEPIINNNTNSSSSNSSGATNIVTVPCNKTSTEYTYLLSNFKVASDANSEIELMSSTSSYSFSLSSSTSIYDKNCNIISASQLAVGDTVDAYYKSNTSPYILVAIQDLS